MGNKTKIIPIYLSIVCVAALAFVLSHVGRSVLFNPAGTIGLQERHLIFIATLLMLLIVLPVFFLTYYFAWKYRAGNEKAHYVPDWNHNPKLELVWWALPTIIVAVLSVVIWKSSQQLDPFKPLPSNNPPITVQVVALDWKWLFIYPQQGIASVNYLEFPVNTPVNFQITADAPMNSFWIPQLGGQIYAMPGMETQLNLMADTAGDYAGSSANLSGVGFSGMTFDAHAVSQGDFQQWVQANQKSPAVLTADAYSALVKPSENNQPTFYAFNNDNLFGSIIDQYMIPGAPTPGTSVGSASMQSMPGMDMSGMQMGSN